MADKVVFVAFAMEDKTIRDFLKGLSKNRVRSNLRLTADYGRRSFIIERGPAVVLGGDSLVCRVCLDFLRIFEGGVYFRDRISSARSKSGGDGMKSLREARASGKLEEFIAEREDDAPGDKRAFDATLSSMAGKSKSKPETSKPGHSDD